MLRHVPLPLLLVALLTIVMLIAVSTENGFLNKSSLQSDSQPQVISGAVGYLLNDDGLLPERLNQLSTSIKLLNHNYLAPFNGMAKGYRIVIFTDSADKIRNEGFLDSWLAYYGNIELIQLEQDHPDFRYPERLQGQTNLATCGGRVWRDGYMFLNVFRIWSMAAHPALDNFEYFLRLDTDMFIEKRMPFDPFQRMHDENLVYALTECTMEKLFECVEGLPEAVGHYVMSRGLTPGHLQDIDWGLAYAGNFGVMKVSWFRQDMYRDFIKYLLSNDGMYLKRWADQNIFALALGLFAKKNQIGHWESLYHDGIAAHKSKALGTLHRREEKPSDLRSPMPLCKHNFGCICHHDGTSRMRLERFNLPHLLARKAYVTYIVGDDFLPGVLVLWKSLLDSGSLQDSNDGPVDFVCMHVGLSPSSLQKLKQIGAVLIGEDQLHNITSPHNQYKDRYKDTQWKMFTKLNAFGLDQYERVVYMDADTMVLQSVRFLLHNTTKAISAVAEKPSLNPEFNAGLIVIDPSRALLDDMMEHLSDDYSCGYRATDQSFLCHYFHPSKRGWHPLPSSLNLMWKVIPHNNSTLESAHVVHFNANKPWLHPIAMNDTLSVQWQKYYNEMLLDSVFAK